MSQENPWWGAPRIHGELLMLGLGVAQSTVSKYLPRRRSPPSQSWMAFLRNQAIAAIDMCVVPTLTFERLFAFFGPGPWPPAAAVVRGDTASQFWMAGTSDHRGIPEHRHRATWCGTTTAHRGLFLHAVYGRWAFAIG
jgi:hypothetical protein